MRKDHTIQRTTTPRWRVALVGGTPPARGALSAAIDRAGGIVAVEHAVPAEALPALERARPDIAIVAPEAAWHGGSVLRRLRDQVCCPVVLLARRPSRRLLDEACEGGAMACLIEPVRAAQVALTLDLALARFRDVQALRRVLADRKVIERAKGLLMVRYGLPEDDAFRRLRRSAMDTQRPLADIARAVLQSEEVAAPAVTKTSWKRHRYDTRMGETLLPC